MRMKFNKVPRHLKLSQKEVDKACRDKGDRAYEMALERAELRRKGRRMKSPNKRTIFI